MNCKILSRIEILLPVALFYAAFISLPSYDPFSLGSLCPEENQSNKYNSRLASLSFLYNLCNKPNCIIQLFNHTFLSNQTLRKRRNDSALSPRCIMKWRKEFHIGFESYATYRILCQRYLISMGLLYFSSLSIIALKRKLRKIFVVSYNVVRMYEKVLSQFFHSTLYDTSSNFWNVLKNGS